VVNFDQDIVQFQNLMSSPDKLYFLKVKVEFYFRVSSSVLATLVQPIVPSLFEKCFQAEFMTGAEVSRPRQLPRDRNALFQQFAAPGPLFYKFISPILFKADIE